MLTLILVSALLTISSANNPKDDAQYMNLQVKNVKGGGSSYVYRGGDNINRFFNHTQHGYVQATQTNHEIGVCYMEVPTSTLVRDPKHIPAGNGSRPELSRIRTCCHGYIRNIHNYLICDPVCTPECVNALCTAPGVCSCFPDHVINLAGFCVATCPIGCQNGHCDGQRCMCKEGFKLDVSGRFCVPHCRDNCSGTGNCTAPNTCECKPGYSSSLDGSCRPGGPSYSQAQHPGTPGVPVPLHTGPGSQSPGSQSPCGSCLNGYCSGTECRCRPGYLLYRGECKALCNPSCVLGKECVAPNVCASKAPGVNATQSHNTPQYPYPNPSQTPYQNPGQYPNGQYPQNQNQYPLPSQNPNNQHNPQYPNSGNHTGQQPNPIYAPYPGQQNQYPGQQNQYYPGQPNQYPQPSPNGNNAGYPNQHPQPGHQHLYPQLPSNYPNTPQHNQGVNGTSPRPDGQTFYQGRPYNPENVTFNLQQGSDQTSGHGQNATQGHYAGGQYSQGQYGQGQFNQGQTSQGQFNHGQTSQGQFNQGQSSQGQFNQGQTSQGEFNHEQTSQGQFGQGQYTQGQYHHGQYGQGQYNQGQYGQGQYNQGQYGQGHNQQGYYPYPGQQGPYGQNGESQQGQISRNGFGNCEQPCINGNCVGTNKCECLPGYNLDPTDSTGNRCVPYCHGGCLNGYCASPNNCVCSEGYHKDFSVKGRSGCVKRVRRSAEPVNLADVLVFEIPDTE
ncbi:LOW QUALITY PROTEIN: glutenin, high molecular weight subunit PW212-like [Leguminivora glycinivorella]|uniref:LOW QUALITY PROTEIN: glutenin, high molecular weight subunit PW212-like n=1 Tax=Leguminivora glycinivorella TaxID=1035111 RepID=UPI0020104F36|nr:LOW QUALITY PROTEIN: glutenin, high molecular weight subunit PW212-like [Leguminivora glycinivorella]